MELQGWDLPEAAELSWDSSGDWSPSMTGSLGCTEWDAEEEVLPFHVREQQDCRELCLGAHHQPFGSAG